MNTDEWLYSTTHQCPCRLLEEQELWGSVTCRVWLQTNDTIVTVPKETLRPLDTAGREDISSYHIRDLATATHIADLLEEPASPDGVLLAPLASRVIHLPHQITALTRALEKESIRSYRLRALTKEMNQWKNKIAAAEEIIPSLQTVLLLRILSNEDKS